MSTTASAAASILDILTREEAHCELLHRTLEQERSALRRLSVTEFPALNEQRISNLMQLQSLEAERASLVNRLADAWGLPRTTVTLQTIIDRLDQLEKREVERCHERLAEKVRTVRQDTAMNALLVSGIQTLCRNAMHLSMKVLPEQGLYSSSGTSQRVGTGGIIMRQRG
ncbi:MAG: flagellar protein FlgN [Nitrospira sp.]|nr:flagellar protein FlgN [Nitrospira sp.]